MTHMDDDAILRLLEDEQRATSLRVADLRHSIHAIVEAAETNALDDEHDPDGSTVAYERAQLLSLLEQAESRLAELALAVDRYAVGDYGKCERCGEFIGIERLQALPATKHCVHCAN